MNKISVVLATYNEEENLGDCLRSIRVLSDEIIVVDGNSIDNTVQIAEQYGAKVIMVENKQIFHINKQIAIDAATKDWVLQLDADERVSESLGKEIKEKIVNTQLNGYWLPRKNWFLGRFLRLYIEIVSKGKGKITTKRCS
jgi:glycosyltransferase involved in cell wall biosynthesis